MITLVGTPKAAATVDGSAVTLTFDVGAGAPLEGDVVIVWGGHSLRAGSGVGPSTAGYNSIITDSASQPEFAVAYKVMGPTPDLDVVCFPSTNAGEANAYACFVLRGFDPGQLQDQTHTVAGPTASTNPDSAAIVTQTANAWVLALALSTSNDTAVTAPVDYVNLINAAGNDGVDASVAGVTREIAVPGSVDPPSYTNWTTGTWKACTLAIRVFVPLSTGDLAAVEPPDVAAFSGGVLVSGNLVASEAPDVAAFSGEVLVEGNLAATEAQDVAAFVGFLVPILPDALDPITGTRWPVITGTRWEVIVR